MRILVGSLIALLITVNVHSAVLFEDNFDSHADFTVAQDADYVTNCVNTSCTVPIPTGYYDYRVADLESCSNTDGNHNTLNINGDQYRGASGKSFQYWSEPCLSDGGSWGSDGLLGVQVTPTDEIYIRHFINFDPTWTWWSGVSSPQQKFMHASHYDTSHPESIYDFFGSTQNKPRAIPGLAKYGSGTYRTQMYYLMSPYNGTSETFLSYLGATIDWSAAGSPGDGDWHCFEWRMKLNTFGNADGIYQFWYDGNLVFSQTTVPWVDAATDPQTRLWNHVWLGGNNYNLYTGGEQRYSVDDFVVSTSYVGTDYVIGETPPTYDSPIVEILTSAQSTTAATITIIGTLVVDSELTATGVTVNDVEATSSDGFETWSAVVPLSLGANMISATGTDSELQEDTDVKTDWITRETPATTPTVVTHGNIGLHKLILH